jgi:hypothetical protein
MPDGALEEQTLATAHESVLAALGLPLPRAPDDPSLAQIIRTDQAEQSRRPTPT